MTDQTTARQEIPGLEDVLYPSFPPAVKFEALNHYFEGTIVGAKSVRATDFKDPSKKLSWPSGEPMMIIVVMVNGKFEREAERSERSLWFRGEALTRALRDTLRKEGVSGIAVGDDIRIAWTGEEEVTGRNGKPLDDPRKLYSVELLPQ